MILPTTLSNLIVVLIAWLVISINEQQRRNQHLLTYHINSLLFYRCVVHLRVTFGHWTLASMHHRWILVFIFDIYIVTDCYAGINFGWDKQRCHMMNCPILIEHTFFLLWDQFDISVEPLNINESLHGDHQQHTLLHISTANSRLLGNYIKW